MSETDDPTLDAVESWIDSFDGKAVRGWAWYPTQPERDVTVEVLIDGEPAAEGVATLHRADLIGAGKRSGRCAFAVPIPYAAFRGRGSVQLTVRAKDGEILREGVFTVIVQPPKTKFPVRFDAGAGATGFIDLFTPEVIDGWVVRPADPSPPVVIEFWEGGSKVHSLVADIWRTDLEEARQGDGRWGFAAPTPDIWRDGEDHVVEVRFAGDEQPAVATPLSFNFDKRADANAPRFARQVMVDERSTRLRPPRDDAPWRPLFTVIVNFYNMRREAERTLTSLTRSYQHGIGKLRYEVLCIDNGSSPPLEQEWIESFGPEFRLIRPSERHPSPCKAINEAARQASGRYLAIMIDGAHVLSPGVLREVWDVVEETPEVVVGLRQWFVGGDQRWLSSNGYTREQEDMLFDKIAWPQDGYKLFKISSPTWESPNHWLDGMIESNCLFMPRKVFQRIGGMDERFVEPGAGYANLDLFKRAVLAVKEPLIAIMGEASFHQFHDGTTTNVTDAQKEKRVRTYENTYARIKGERYLGVPPLDIRLSGQLRSLDAIVGRQRPLSPAKIGVTPHIRQGVLSVHFDDMAEANLQSVYVECGLHKLTKWRGHHIFLAPTDIVEIQDILFQGRPDRIVVVNAAEGLVLLLDSLLRMLGLEESRIIVTGETLPEHDTMPETVDLIPGRPDLAQTQRAVERALGTEERILVLFAPSEGDFLPVDALRAYARFVSCRSYLIFLGTAFGQPWLGYSKNWFRSAINTLVHELPFVVDHSRTLHFVTACPSGYLQRILPTSSAIDEVADVFADL